MQVLNARLPVLLKTQHLTNLLPVEMARKRQLLLLPIPILGVKQEIEVQAP